MKNISKYGLILIFTFTLVFHLLVITGIIPFDIVWGGRLKNQREMIVFETISLIINLFFLVVVLMKTAILKPNFSEKVLNVILWIMFGLFVLNTIGNFFSESSLERLIFTPVTFLLAIFSFLLIRKKA